MLRMALFSPMLWNIERELRQQSGCVCIVFVCRVNSVNREENKGKQSGKGAGAGEKKQIQFA